jgi:hypothetical protein
MVLVSLIISTIAYQVIFERKIYAMQTLISVKEENNFVYFKYELNFNWGGTSDQVQTISTTLQSSQ